MPTLLFVNLVTIFFLKINNRGVEIMSWVERFRKVTKGGGEGGGATNRDSRVSFFEGRAR